MGIVGVYGHVNDILSADMLVFADFVEQNELGDLKKIRADGRALAAKSLEAGWKVYHVSVCCESICAPAWSASQTHKIRKEQINIQ